MTSTEITDCLLAHRFNFVNEQELQDGMWSVLVEAGFGVRREVSLTAANRIDFMVGSVGIEVKVDGSLSALLRQSMRYARCEEILELLIVTALARHLNMPPTLNNKPVAVCHLRNAF